MIKAYLGLPEHDIQFSSRHQFIDEIDGPSEGLESNHVYNVKNSMLSLKRWNFLLAYKAKQSVNAHLSSRRLPVRRTYQCPTAQAEKLQATT